MEIVGDYEIILNPTQLKIQELEEQIEQLKKQNDNLKSLLISRFQPYLNAILECL